MMERFIPVTAMMVALTHAVYMSQVGFDWIRFQVICWCITAMYGWRVADMRRPKP
jgi:hypothetical protein